MTTRLRRFMHLLARSRLELAFPAIANNWLVIFLARHLETSEGTNPVLANQPLFISLLLGAVVAAGLSIYGLILNDVMDARHDRAFSPDRPIPAGRVGLRGAIALAFVALLAGFGAAIYLGTESGLLCVVAALAAAALQRPGQVLPRRGHHHPGPDLGGGDGHPQSAHGFRLAGLADHDSRDGQ